MRLFNYLFNQEIPNALIRVRAVDVARNRSDLDISWRAGQRDFLESWISDARMSVHGDCRPFVLGS